MKFSTKSSSPHSKSQYKMYGDCAELCRPFGSVIVLYNTIGKNKQILIESCDKLDMKWYILDIYLKTLSSVYLRTQFSGVFNTIWTCVPDVLPSFKMAVKNHEKAYYARANSTQTILFNAIMFWSASGSGRSKTLLDSVGLLTLSCTMCKRMHETNFNW